MRAFGGSLAIAQAQMPKQGFRGLGFLGVWRVCCGVHVFRALEVRGEVQEFSGLGCPGLELTYRQLQ